jgi:hypothetical protein
MTARSGVIGSAGDDSLGWWFVLWCGIEPTGMLWPLVRMVGDYTDGHFGSGGSSRHLAIDTQSETAYDVPVLNPRRIGLFIVL